MGDGNARKKPDAVGNAAGSKHWSQNGQPQEIVVQRLQQAGSPSLNAAGNSEPQISPSF
jgi:hypothetical protein